MRPARPWPAYALFALSGFCALVYETVWTRWLVLVFGATVPSASAVLAGFMGGLALGSLLGSRWSRDCRNPLALYGRLELAAAACAACFPALMSLIVAAVEGTALPLGPLRLGLSIAAVLPAAVLMGATFPVMSRHCAGSSSGPEVSELYAANLAGACLGVFASAFFFFAVLGLAGSHWLAVIVNAGVGAAALALSRSAAAARIKEESAVSAPLWPAVAVFASGLCGMAFEVIWIRLLVPSFNNSAYGFAAVLFVFLSCLGLGSWLSGRLPASGLAALGGLQWLAALFAFVGYRTFELSQVAQSRYADMTNSGVSPFLFMPLAEAFVVLAPLAILQGMMLPAAVRLSPRPEGAGESVGRLYFWNTAGAIAGALAAGFWWIQAYNVQNSLLIVMAIALASGALLLSIGQTRLSMKAAAPLLAALALGLAWWRLAGKHLPAELLMEWGTRYADMAPRLLYYKEDIEGSVAVQARGGGKLLVINGVGVAGMTNATKMLAHIPLLIHPEPKKTLIICFGTGTTFRSALRHPVEVDSVDLVGAVYEAFPQFYKDAGRWAADPRARRLVNDGRNHLLRSRQGYDAILVDPSPPLFAAGTVNLYSRDFFKLAARKLKPGGLLAVWLPEYPEPEFNMVAKTFLSALPHSQLWRGTSEDQGIVLLGSNQPIAVDRAQVEERLKEAGLRQDLLELDQEFAHSEAFWKLYLGPGERFAGLLADSPEVTDNFPRIEYPYFRSKFRDYYRHPELMKWSSLFAAAGSDQPTPR